MSSMRHRFLSVNIASVIMFCGAMGLPAFAQVDCLTLSNRSPTMPNPVSGSPFITGAYDSIRQVTVFHQNIATNSNVTWEWDGAAWTQVSTAGPDIAGFNSSLTFDMVFDSSRGVSVMLIFGVVWEWNGATWTQRTDVLDPQPLTTSHDLAFDSKRDVVVTFGGRIDTAGNTGNQTWEYDGTSWALLSPGNPPPARSKHRISYDSDRDVIVLFGGLTSGGVVLDDTWEYDRVLDTWQQRNIAVGSTVPPARLFHGMVYDSERGVTTMYAGFDATGTGTSLGDIWDWDGQEWTLRGPTLDGVLLSELNRGKPVVVYDSARQRTVMIGGTLSDADNLVLELSAPPRPQITLQPVSQTVVAGQPVVFTVEATSSEALAYQWRFNGVDIVDATQANHAIGAASMADAGVYDVVVGLAGHDPFACPEAISDPVILNVNQAVAGDVDGDGDFDLDDLAMLLPGFTGPLP